MQLCVNNVGFILFFSTVLLLNKAATIIYAAPHSGNGNETDHLALLSFKSMITHDPNGVLSSWNTSSHFCNWEGVTCGKRRHRRVTILDLSSRELGGSLSPHVGNLSFLRQLWLNNNTFQGTIPQELGRLFRLQDLKLSINNFDGVIPSNLSRCSNLLTLALSRNNLVGNIPVEVSLLPKLTFLSVDSNNLTGGIPPSIGNLTSLEQFYIVYTPIGGSIPDTLGRLKSLRILSLGYCNLSGTIPPSLYNLSLLSIFSLPHNQLTGSLPPNLGETLSSLGFFQLTQNQLTGSLPHSISNCSNLYHLELSDNKFSGKLNVDFARLTNIVQIMLHINDLGSREPDEMIFFYSMANCSKLQMIDLSFNKLKGELPNYIGNLSNSVSILGLGENQLYGSLTPSIGNLVGLKYLVLNENKFIGNIPATIGNLQNLQYLGLSANQMSGSIPDSLGNVSKLIQVYLDSNMLQGKIPSSLGNCQDLLVLDLSRNKLNGSIPKQLLMLSSLSVYLNISQNNLSGSLPSEVGQLKNLNVLDLSENGLSGIIPDISGCTSLESLYFQGNFFQGMIPLSLSSLRGIVRLDLSQNNLSGYIPQFMEQLSLQYLNLSLNDLEGEVPLKGVFANPSEVWVFGNSRLCGGVPELGLTKCKETKKPKIRNHVLVIVISIACSFLALFISFAFLLLWNKKKKKSQQSDSLVKEKFLKISYEMLRKATDGFSEVNLIGAGGTSSVYKGILDDGRIVAVKVLHLQYQVAYKSFLAECVACRNIRHRNLLKIITSCSSIDFQGNDFRALVYEYMPNGSLNSWLHSSTGMIQRLNLLQRVTILMDVAMALDYLHNRCQPPVVHCDIKPSNILLDDDMVAHVGDFGLAKFLQTEASHNSSIGIKGTIGYTAPEYSLGNEMTKNGDIYSFGILLLETMTGKRPTDDMFREGLDLHKLASMAMPDRVTEIVEMEMLKFDQEDEIGSNGAQNPLQNTIEVVRCLVSTVRIGVACSLEYPHDRMKIEDVIRELQHVRDALNNIFTTYITQPGPYA